MIFFPAIDIKGGVCVRLTQGRADKETVFAKDPVAMARHWQSQGAEWLHIVDLDGAFEGVPANRDLVREICRAVDIPVQLGGGIRDMDTAGAYLEAGVRRLIIGTLALEAPEAYAALIKAFPGRIGVSLDAENGKLKSKGWVADSGYTVDDVLPRLTEQGTAFLVYTDISRDGTGKGVTLPAVTALAEKSRIPVIAAGGVHTMEDIKNLHRISLQANLEGAISGRAIYEGTLDTAEATRWLKEQTH